MAAFVRVSGPPNGHFIVGYPGIAGTLPRIEGKVEIRPSAGISAPVNIAMVTICLQRRETIHPSADSVTKRHLAAPRKELTEIVGREMLLFRCAVGRDHEEIIAMDLPFVLFFPYVRQGQNASRQVPASLQLPSRTAETYYELVVMVQQGPSEQRKYAFPVPISRYDTLSSFGQYKQPRALEKVSDHLVTMGISVPRTSFGPLDPISVVIKLSPNPDWLNKARRVTIHKISISIDEEIIYNHEGDEPQRKTKSITKRIESVNMKLPEAGYITNLGLIFPSRDLRDAEGILPRGKPAFPMYAVNGFSTVATLYRIDYYLTVKAHLTSARDIVLRQPIMVCPFDHTACVQETDAINAATAAAANINPDNPMLPLPTIIRVRDPQALKYLGVAIVGNVKKPVIE
ncbi:hypothetical protein RJZ56_000830 [Blastomyces dermatitidis]|uniref:Arrestin domain-containing protein n=3 Tax=Blastomyces TaxID=229219 RepID=A0A179UXT7_BLAGS|nr:arrestin domain-containing protein [Blastomyces gilchristii SLH14081]XP_045278290.1 arrestin domain-containing protein [Blastomyces dermatitidis ER-3]EGE81136.1 arrestin domain-containing protein [Blastomyces dermatitidis ATCC 18188]EQL34866.1 hypothetical protein BDFG_03312 [Blastomyces dermatitidis ATCC 26199]EEQ91828.1 arrestin domain-containing protein [Blastomyces dermatitidis ER-3]OAT12623.1 arrestin domain-containing protein [Blastomyces gilchristii SLH14081]